MTVTLEDMLVKPNTLGPNGEPLFVPASNARPLREDEILDIYRQVKPFGSDPEDWEGFEDDTEVPCGCGG